MLRFLLLLASDTDPAVYNGRSGRLDVQPPRLEAELTVDGSLGEPAWAQAAILTGFSQFTPVDGVPAVDSTEVLVWYSETAIHFGIRAFEAHGQVHATLADRDKIGADDNVQILLGTFDDGRQASVFAVNPFGVQSDGALVETGSTSGNGFNSAVVRRENADLSPDFVFESKGRLTDYGYEVEVRIPFKSLRFQPAPEQRWGINITRQVQHSGAEDSWAPAKRASASFLAQSGHLVGLTELRRGLVLEFNPSLTSKTTGARGAGGWEYAGGGPEPGGSIRWGITNNLNLNATANPDFSQVESDAGQFLFDPRNELFFSEKRPFFLDGIEQFGTPNALIYTRRIVQPVAAAKLTGKGFGTDIALLSAVDDAAVSPSGDDHPVYNLLRLQRDVGAQSRLGLVYTDRIIGSDFNRVAGLDAFAQFSGNLFVLWGHDENFLEWASGDLTLFNAGLDWRPTDQLRLNGTYQLQRVGRRSDGSTVNVQHIPRLKVEYQVSRPIFLRLVGEYASERQDDLRDHTRTEAPLLIFDPAVGDFVRATAFKRKSVRGGPAVLVPAESGDGAVRGVREHAAGSGRSRRSAARRAAAVRRWVLSQDELSLPNVVWRSGMPPQPRGHAGPFGRCSALAREIAQGSKGLRFSASLNCIHEALCVWLPPILQDALPGRRGLSSGDARRALAACGRRHARALDGARPPRVPHPELARGGRALAGEAREQPEDLAQRPRPVPAPLHSGRRRRLGGAGHVGGPGVAVRPRGGRRSGRRDRALPAGRRLALHRGDRLLAGRGVLGARHHDRGGAPVHRIRLRGVRSQPDLWKRLRVECGVRARAREGGVRVRGATPPRGGEGRTGGRQSRVRGGTRFPA